MLSHTTAASNMSATDFQTFTPTTHHDTYPFIANANHDGRVVFITGASRGIGRATALAFVRSGASTLILAARSDLDDLKTEILSLRPAVNVIVLSLDVTSEESVDAALLAVSKHVSSIDILINNAGYLEEPSLFKDSNRKEWWRTWEVNIKGTYLVSQAFMDLVLASQSKTIVNVGSKGGLYTRRGASAYGTSKAALLRISEFLDFEYSEQGLLVFAVHPGSVSTDLALRLPETSHSILIDKPQLAADTLTWLTEEVRAWLGGRYVSVNWDMAEFVSRKDEIVQQGMLKLRLQG